MAFFTDDISINTIIGIDSKFIGNISVSGFLRIDGDVDGNIETTGKIFIGEKARVRGNITASSAEICGIVLGDITAPKKIKLFSSSAVIGDITTRNIEIEDNGIFHGHCISLKSEELYSESVSSYSDEKIIKSKVL
ncbi:MAG: polymer-forming cytoskeletal protein [Treponema sp.]|nr:polymer-forming cytoskeletal protein [Treponema sp.]